MKEIGGYLGLEQLISDEYYKDLISLNCGRNSLLYLLKTKKIKKIFLPYFLCSVIRNSLAENNCEFDYYEIDNEFMPIFNKKLGADEYIYIVNYYGQISNEKVISLNKQFKKIILDNTHAFFQKPILGVDTIYTCRKFLGVPDGAYLSTNIILDENIGVDVSKDRMIHILGRYEGLASDYYKYSRENDEVLNSQPIKYMSKLTHNILGAIDYERVRRIRNENYAYLDSEFYKENRLNLNVPYGAFAYPLYNENALEIRKKLSQNKIYIPTIWPNVINESPQESIEYKYAANILPIPCDQRYNLMDMEMMVELVKKY